MTCRPFGLAVKGCRHYERIVDDVVDRVTAVTPAKRLVQVIARLVGGPVLGETEVTVDGDRGEEKYRQEAHQARQRR